jgi:hypothetical protein
MVLYDYMCCVFLIRRESSDMILRNKPHISEVVLSQELNLGMKRLKDENECRTPMLISVERRWLSALCERKNEGLGRKKGCGNTFDCLNVSRQSL